MDTGVPLSNLVMAELLRRAQPGLSNTAIQRQLEFEVRYRPSVLTSALLDESERFTATEMADADKPPVLREYLRKWGWEVGRFFEGVTADATEEQIQGIAPGFPVFRITITS